MKTCLEKNVWYKSDDTQWIKYMDKSNENEHWFKVVDCMIVPANKNPHCIFRAMSVLIETEDLYNGSLEEYICGYYDCIEEILSEYKDNALQIIAECIAETDMFSGRANNYEDIFIFNLDEESEDFEKQVYSKCDEVEKYIKENL